MAKLYIAEKPSLAKAIVAVLPKPHTIKNGYIQVGNGDSVSWCIGHLLQSAPPEKYDPKYKRWMISDLPILPTQWQYVEKESSQKQLHILMQLIKKHDELIHAGDPDREGQLLVDEVFHYCQLSQTKRLNIKRCFINDLNPKAVQKALNQLQSNQLSVPLSVSALARSRADWLFGMNLSRLCTLKGRQNGINQVLSIGRVQTPLLALVVQRDESIAHFVSHLFYELFVHLKRDSQPIEPAQKPAFLKLKWQKNERSESVQDEEGRIIQRAFLEQIEHKVIHQPMQITEVIRKDSKMAPPLPFNLSQLQIELARIKGLSAQKVLDIAQSLYEKEKLITYPRSDSRYLPTTHYTDRQSVLAAISTNLPQMSVAIQECELNLRSNCWNDSKVSAHHAIIPTEKKANLDKLSADAKLVYQLIARQYLAQFYPSAIFEELKITATVKNEVFSTQIKRLRQSGWRILFSFPEEKESASLFNLNINPGDSLICEKTEIEEKQTTPPQPFNDATLLSAMTGISRFVKNPTIKKILKETDGIGTEATRAGMIELLFKRQFLQRKGKTIQSTDLGKQLIKSLPETLIYPDMTAIWEQQLDQICAKKLSYHHFMTSITIELLKVMDEVNQKATQLKK